MRTDPRFSREYLEHIASPRWRKIRGLTFAVTLGRDCVCPLFRAREAHHLSYRNLGHELPILDTVPLSHGIHELVTAFNLHGRRGPRQRGPLVDILAICLRLSCLFWTLAMWWPLLWVLMLPLGPRDPLPAPWPYYLRAGRLLTSRLEQPADTGPYQP